MNTPASDPTSESRTDHLPGSINKTTGARMSETRLAVRATVTLDTFRADRAAQKSDDPKRTAAATASVSTNCTESAKSVASYCVSQSRVERVSAQALDMISVNEVLVLELHALTCLGIADVALDAQHHAGEHLAR